MGEPALVFFLGRLAAPQLEVGLPDRFDLPTDLVSDATAVRRLAQAGANAGGMVGGGSDAGFETRVQADGQHPVGGVGAGLLTLSQEFGSVYLGQVRCWVNGGRQSHSSKLCNAAHTATAAAVPCGVVVRRACFLSTHPPITPPDRPCSRSLRW